MSAGVIDTRDFGASYEEVRRRLRRIEQNISNPDLQIGAGGIEGGNEFEEIVITNPGAGPNIIIGFDVAPPTGLSALTSTYLEEVYIDASWSAPVGELPAEYEVELSRQTSPGVYATPRVYRTAGTSVRLIVPLGGVTYGIRVASINHLGVRSTFTTRFDITTAVDATIPPAVSGLSVVAGVNTLVVTFNRLTALEAADMQNGEGLYRIQLSSNDFVAVISDKFTTSNVESFDSLTQGTNYKVRVAAIDPSGNQGPYTTSSAVQPGYVTNTHIGTNSINGDRITADTITGAKILAGSVDGDRITANTLNANRIATSSLTAADITLAGGSLIAGSPVTGDGALLNSQGFKLYKDGQLTVNLDALTGDATFTGNVVGSYIYGGLIEAPEIIGSFEVSDTILPNGTFDSNVSGWATVSGGGGTLEGLNCNISHAVPPQTVINSGNNAARVHWSGSGSFRPVMVSPLIPVSSRTLYTAKATVRCVGYSDQIQIFILQFKADGVTLQQQHPGEILQGGGSVIASANTTYTISASLNLYAGTEYVKVVVGGIFSQPSPVASPDGIAGTFLLVDDVHLVRDRGLFNIQYNSKPLGKNRMILQTVDLNPATQYHRILFSNPEDASVDADHKDGYIQYHVNGGNTSSIRSRVLRISTGGYIVPAGDPWTGSINESAITLQSGQVNLLGSMTASSIVASAGTISLSVPGGAYVLRVRASELSNPGVTVNNREVYYVKGAWTNVTFQNGWVNYDAATARPANRPCQYRLVGDEVQFRGVMKNGTPGTAAFTIPAAWVAPTPADHFPIVANSAISYARVNSSGQFIPDAAAGNVWIDISSVRYSYTI